MIGALPIILRVHGMTMCQQVLAVSVAEVKFWIRENLRLAQI